MTDDELITLLFNLLMDACFFPVILSSEIRKASGNIFSSYYFTSKYPSAFCILVRNLI